MNVKTKTKKRITMLFIVCLSLFTVLFSGCSFSEEQNAKEIVPGTSNGEYATQQRLSAIEYSLYVNKQITVFSEQLQTRLNSCINLGVENDSEVKRAEHSVEIMKKAKNGMEITYPSKERDADREEVLEAMDVSINDTENYIADLKQGKDVKKYASIFKEDVNQLTGLASLYYE